MNGRGVTGTMGERAPVRRGWTGRSISPARAFLLIWLVAAAINLAVGATMRFRTGMAGFEADEAEYLQIARQILDGTLEFSARRTLLYPLVLAGLLRVGGIMLAQYAVTAIYALSPPLLFLAVRRVTGSMPAALLAGAALALWPPAIFFGTSIYSESVALPAFLLAIVLLPPGSRTGAPAFGSALGCGFALALATQIRPMYLLFLPGLVLTVLLEERRIATAARRAIVALLGFAILTAPWSAYMTWRFGHLILVTSNGGETLAGGLNPVLLSTPRREQVPGRNTWIGPGKWLDMEHSGYLSPRELALPYDQRDEILRSRTRAWALAHPRAAAYIETQKLGYMWGFSAPDRNGRLQWLFGDLPTLCALLCGAVALVAWPRSRTGLARFWMLPLFVSGVALISWGSWRFRQPGDAGLLALDAAALVMALLPRLHRFRQVKIEDMA